MKYLTGHKALLYLVLIIAVVLLCILPLLFNNENKLYIYTDKIPQQSFLNELKQTGFNVMLNSHNKPKEGSDALWLSVPQQLEEIQDNNFRFNFVYTEDNYPFDWQQLKIPVIMLTPHQKIYEHYMRSNVPTAKFKLTDKTSAQRFYDIWKWLNENRQTNFAD